MLVQGGVLLIGIVASSLILYGAQAGGSDDRCFLIIHDVCINFHDKLPEQGVTADADSGASSHGSVGAAIAGGR